MLLSFFFILFRPIICIFFFTMVPFIFCTHIHPYSLISPSSYHPILLISFTGFFSHFSTHMTALSLIFVGDLSDLDLCYKGLPIRVLCPCLMTAFPTAPEPATTILPSASTSLQPESNTGTWGGGGLWFHLMKMPCPTLLTVVTCQIRARKLVMWRTQC